MTVSLVTDERLVVPPVLGWAVLTGGAVALFATYWDEAWHTDIGRDSAWIAPHLLLYGAMAVAGSAIAAWGVRTWWTTRSLRTALRYQPVLVAGLGGGVAAEFALAQAQSTYPTSARLARASGLPVVGSVTEILTSELRSQRRKRLGRFVLAGAGLASLCIVLLAVEFFQRSTVG